MLMQNCRAVLGGGKVYRKYNLRNLDVSYNKLVWLTGTADKATFTSCSLEVWCRAKVAY